MSLGVLKGEGNGGKGKVKEALDADALGVLVSVILIMSPPVSIPVYQ